MSTRQAKLVLPFVRNMLPCRGRSVLQEVTVPASKPASQGFQATAKHKQRKVHSCHERRAHTQHTHTHTGWGHKMRLRTWHHRHHADQYASVQSRARTSVRTPFFLPLRHHPPSDLPPPDHHRHHFQRHLRHRYSAARTLLEPIRPPTGRVWQTRATNYQRRDSSSLPPRRRLLRKTAWGRQERGAWAALASCETAPMRSGAYAERPTAQIRQSIGGWPGVGDGQQGGQDGWKRHVNTLHGTIN